MSRRSLTWEQQSARLRREERRRSARAARRRMAAEAAEVLTGYPAGDYYRLPVALEVSHVRFSRHLRLAQRRAREHVGHES